MLPQESLVSCSGKAMIDNILVSMIGHQEGQMPTTYLGFVIGCRMATLFEGHLHSKPTQIFKLILIPIPIKNLKGVGRVGKFPIFALPSPFNF